MQHYVTAMPTWYKLDIFPINWNYQRTWSWANE